MQKPWVNNSSRLKLIRWLAGLAGLVADARMSVHRGDLRTAAERLRRHLKLVSGCEHTSEDPRR